MYVSSSLAASRSAIAASDSDVKGAISALDRCAGPASARSTAGFAASLPTAALSPSPTMSRDAAELIEFATQFRMARAFERDIRLVTTYPDGPRPDESLSAFAQRIRAYFLVQGGVLIVGMVEQNYAGLLRTPLTRAFVDTAVSLVHLQKQLDLANADWWDTSSRGDLSALSAIKAAANTLEEQVSRGWTELTDHIDDSLRTYGSSWTKLGGRP